MKRKQKQKNTTTTKYYVWGRSLKYFCEIPTKNTNHTAPIKHKQTKKKTHTNTNHMFHKAFFVIIFRLFLRSHFALLIENTYIQNTYKTMKIHTHTEATGEKHVCTNKLNGQFRKKITKNKKT